MNRNVRRLLIAAAVIIVLGIGGFAFWPQHDAPATGSQLGQMMQDGSLVSADPSTGVQPYGSTPPVDSNKQNAIEAHHQYGEYYLCRTYPDDTRLAQADLVPTANVVVTITYNPHKGKYVVKGDPRITVHETDKIRQADGSDFTQPTRVQELRFSFADYVHYFGAFQRYQDGTHNIAWGAVTLYGKKLVGKHMVSDYSLPLYPDGNGTADPVYVIVATDIRTCKAGKVSVPAGFSWAQIGNNGLLLPEFYGTGEHPQG